MGRRKCARRCEAFVARYHGYFARNNDKSPVKKKELDPLPRVILVPGVGMFGIGATAKDAAIAADIAENAIAVITDAEAIGEYRCISEYDMFEVEYWSLEQAKLGKSNEKVAGAPGRGDHRRRLGHRRGHRASAMAKEGAEVAILDRDRRGRQGGGQEDRRQGAGGRLRRHRSGQRARGLRQGGVENSAAWISWSPMPARPGRAPSARWMTKPCAKASN